MLYMPAAHYTTASREVGDISWIVIHDMEMSETPTTAEACARMFATTTREASAHYCIDNDSIVQCVRDKDIAWAAPGANSRGIQIELAGYAAQTSKQWADAFSSNMLRLASEHVATLCKLYGIPAQYVNREGLRAGRRGITTHNEVSLAFRKSTHTDPGPNFPIIQFISQVNTFGGKHITPARDLSPTGLVTVNGTSFFTVFRKWYTIRQGSRFWAETIALQYSLNGYTHALGRRPLTLDGLFGNQTAEYLAAYQRWVGIPVNSIADIKVARLLKVVR